MDARPLPVSSEEASKLPVLIVDKKGFIGKGLARALCEQFLVVIVTAEEVETHDNIIHIPYKRKIPVIPDNTYSQLFIVYNGEREVLDMLPSFNRKAEQSKSSYLFVTSLPYSTKKLFAFLNTHASPRLKVLMYGETFANRNTEKNEVNFIIHQAKVYGRIEVPNTGLGTLYPVLYEDVINGIITLAQHPEIPERLIYTFTHHPFSQISIARILQKIDPLIRVDFKKHRVRVPNYYIPQNGVYMYRDYDLEEKLRTIDLGKRKEIPPIPQKQLKMEVHDPEAQKRRSVIFMTLLFSLFIAPILLTAVLAVSAVGFLSLSLQQAERGEIRAAQNLAGISRSAFTATESLVPSLILPALFIPAQTDQFLQTIHTGREVVDTELDALAAVQLVQNIYEGKSLDPKNDFHRALATLKNTLLTFQKMQAEKKLPKNVEEKLDGYTGVLHLVEGTIDTWPALLGFEGKKTYLVLFQNNMELRPGGGFIGSYGILSITNGQMETLQINDIYDADGQLKEKIEPPYGLRRYLGASNWFMRDSNYEIDYPRNAIQASQFLQKETGQDVDGVIAIDTTFLQNLLRVLGEVEVQDYNERVNADNFYLLTQTHAEKDFFPGSTQKKDFLRSLSNAMTQELFETREYSYEKLLEQTEKSIREKHMLFAFQDAGIQNVFTVNGLSSSLREGRVQDRTTFLDFFSVNDANVGTNKVNYYVTRAMTQNVRFDSTGALQATAEVTYTNSSGKDSPFGGDYKNFVRFLVPEDAILQNIFIDNVEQEIIPAITDASIYKAEDFVQPRGLEVEQTESLGKKSIGFFFIVPQQDSMKITITYRVPQAVNLESPALTYSMRLFKQPGTLEDPYRLTFSYPQSYEVVRAAKGAVEVGGKFNFETKLSEDREIEVTLSKK